MINRECGTFKRTYSSDMGLYRLPITKITMVAAVIFFFAVFPAIASDYFFDRANFILIFVVAALGLNILTGYTGQISVGHAGFMSVGAYTGAILVTRAHLPFWIALPAGGAMAAIVGTFFGIPSLRIKGFYLAIVTMAAQFIIEWTINHVTWISGGVQASIYVPPPALGSWVLESKIELYYLMLIVATGTIIFTLNLFRSPVGRAFIAIRENDISAEIIGIPVFRYKLLSFATSSFFAGMAGVLYTFYMGIANYEQFLIIVSIELLAMVIIGGMGSVLGTIFGVIFIQTLPIWLRVIVEGGGGIFFDVGGIKQLLAEIQEIMFGLLIIFFLVVEPEGLKKLWNNMLDYFRVWPFSY
jgi:branched-chain amino acid transport system permease protein